MRRAALVASLALVGACGGADHGAKTPGGAHRDLPGMVLEAMREEAKGDPARATSLWLGALDAAVDSPGDAWQIATEEAALDALVLRSITAFEDASPDVALVYRTRDASLAPCTSWPRTAGTRPTPRRGARRPAARGRRP